MTAVIKLPIRSRLPDFSDHQFFSSQSSHKFQVCAQFSSLIFLQLIKNLTQTLPGGDIK